jgi:uncharacterized protein YbjQ (UPF0145 family)
MTMAELCTCGFLKQMKAGQGTKGGRVVCMACELPLFEESESTAAARQAVTDMSVVTLQSLPGHRIVKVLGPVSMLSGSSGLTATVKGQAAVGTAMQQLVVAAAGMGANAVVGLTASTFGAGGGITSAFGGDAVGVLLLGTAVIVEPDDGTIADA